MRKKKEEKKKIISNLCVQMRTEITEGEGRRVEEWGPLYSEFSVNAKIHIWPL